MYKISSWNMILISNDFWHKRKMYNFDPYNVLLAIATNIPVLLMTAFVLQGHILHCFLLWLITDIIDSYRRSSTTASTLRSSSTRRTLSKTTAHSKWRTLIYLTAERWSCRYNITCGPEAPTGPRVQELQHHPWVRSHRTLP